VSLSIRTSLAAHQKKMGPRPILLAARERRRKRKIPADGDFSVESTADPPGAARCLPDRPSALQATKTAGAGFLDREF